jgi:hypothetical protein
VLDFCSNVDPADEQLFDKQSERLFLGMSDKSADQLRHSAVFKEARKTLESVLGELPVDQARAACKDFRSTTII